VTFPNFTALSANVSPAIPEPITRKSVLFFITSEFKEGAKIQIDVNTPPNHSFFRYSPSSFPPLYFVKRGIN
jgi:hypothetical protein